MSSFLLEALPGLTPRQAAFLECVGRFQISELESFESMSRIAEHIGLGKRQPDGSLKGGARQAFRLQSELKAKGLLSSTPYRGIGHRTHKRQIEEKRFTKGIEGAIPSGAKFPARLVWQGFAIRKVIGPALQFIAQRTEDWRKRRAAKAAAKAATEATRRADRDRKRESRTREREIRQADANPPPAPPRYREFDRYKPAADDRVTAPPSAAMASVAPRPT